MTPFELASIALATFYANRMMVNLGRNTAGLSLADLLKSLPSLLPYWLIGRIGEQAKLIDFPGQEVAKTLQGNVKYKSEFGAI